MSVYVCLQCNPWRGSRLYRIFNQAKTIHFVLSLSWIWSVRESICVQHCLNLQKQTANTVTFHTENFITGTNLKEDHTLVYALVPHQTSIKSNTNRETLLLVGCRKHIICVIHASWIGEVQYTYQSPDLLESWATVHNSNGSMYTYMLFLNILIQLNQCMVIIWTN